MLIYAIPSLVAVIVNVCVIILIYKFNPKLQVNTIWFLFTLALLLITFGEFVSRVAESNFRIALLCDMLMVTGVGLAVFFFFYFSLIYPRPFTNISNTTGKAIILTSFILDLLFIINAIIGVVIRELTPSVPGIGTNIWGFYTLNDMYILISGVLYIPSMIFLMIIIVISIAIIFVRYQDMDRGNRKSYAYIILGVLVFLTFAIGSEIILPLIGYNVLGFTSVGVTFLGFIIAYAIVKHRLFIIEPVKERKIIELIDPLDPGYCYLAVEQDIDNPQISYDLFCKHVKSGIPGVVITSKDPHMIRRKYGLERTLIMHVKPVLTTPTISPHPELSENMSYVFEVDSTSLYDSISLVSEYLTKTESGVVIIDCLESLPGPKESITIQQRQIYMENVVKFIGFIIQSNARLVVGVVGPWFNIKTVPNILKTKVPLRYGNEFAILILEQLCNIALKSCDEKKPEAIIEALAHLSKKDVIFKNFKYDETGIVINYDDTSHFTFGDMIHYLKFFLNESKISMLTPEIINKLSEYGINTHEYLMDPGSGYLINVRSSAESIAIFSEFLDVEYHGLFISRLHPKYANNISDRLKERATFRWLTDYEDSDIVVQPKLEYIQREVEEFIESCGESRFIVVLESLLYLVKYVGSFDEIHLFTAKLRDMVADKNGILIVPIDRNAFSPAENAILEQELNRIN